MTRKDYLAIASAIRECKQDLAQTIENSIENSLEPVLHKILKLDNSRFCVQTFKEACKVPHHQPSHIYEPAKDQTKVSIK